MMSNLTTRHDNVPLSHGAFRQRQWMALDRSGVVDLLAAALLTLLGTALATMLAGGVPAIGIDDAAITRSYSENIANGLGYVYNAGGEHVEGSTSFLWTMVVALIYRLTVTPEVTILLVTGLLTWLATYSALRLLRCLAERLGLSGQHATLALCVFLAASPAYFLWSVWTMMETALWSCMALLLISKLVRCVEAEEAAPGASVYAAAVALPLIRPEGIAVAVGLLALSALLDRGLRLRLGAAVLLALTAFAAVSLFRLSYFGQPFPNTFYAKVSSDRMQDIIDGSKYALSFVLGSPFVSVFVAAWSAAALWGVLGALRGQPGARGVVVAAAGVFGFLAVYAGLGGDHFAQWRFYQPIMPLLPAAFALGVALCLVRVRGAGVFRAPMLASGLLVVGIGWMQYYQSRFDITKEFDLTRDGLEFGTYLNGVTPLPSIGVGPAGGIALAYEGYIYDLLGLNWTEMAHANPVKTGMRNHASFDKATFWANRPDVLATFNRECLGDGKQVFWASNDDAFDGIFSDRRFRAEFVPVLFRQGADCWPGFAVPDWLDEISADSGVTTLTWDQIEIRE